MNSTSGLPASPKAAKVRSIAVSTRALACAAGTSDSGAVAPITCSASGTSCAIARPWPASPSSQRCRSGASTASSSPSKAIVNARSACTTGAYGVSRCN